MDAPLHFIDGADGIDKVKPDAFIGPCTVLEVSPGIITGSVVEEYFPRRAERILLKSGGRAFIHRSAADAWHISDISLSVPTGLTSSRRRAKAMKLIRRFSGKI